MKNILSAEAVPALDEVAREQMLLVFDFDGTLAPTVDDRALAQLRPSTRALLRVVSLAHPCAVVSGRSRADLLPRLEGLPLVAAIGNHGAEAGHGPVDRSLRGAVEGWKASLSRCVAGLPGVELEDKGLSLALHYRRAPSRAAARRALRAATGALPGARVLAGRAVVNVVPAGASDKGAAVAHVLERAGRRRALYVGDDRSDETAFRAEGVAVGVRVGRTHASAAPYYLPSQAAIDDLLRCIVASRCRLDGRAATPDAVDRWLTFDA